jgi:hypothetical protein
LKKVTLAYSPEQAFPSLQDLLIGDNFFGR